MKDRETASRTSELLPCLKKWPASLSLPPLSPHPLATHQFLLGTPVCSVSDDKCNRRLSLVSSGSEQGRSKGKAEVSRKNCISVE